MKNKKLMILAIAIAIVSFINMLSPFVVNADTKIESFAMVSAGARHTLALKDDGTVWAWGWNYYGQLGDGTKVEKHTPVQVENLNNIIAISAGEYFNMALKDDGTVWAWGRNESGQLGDNTLTDKTKPIRITTIENIIDISCGRSNSLALKSNGVVYEWGYLNHTGTPINGTLLRVPTVKSGLPSNITKIKTGAAVSISEKEHSSTAYAITEDGLMYAWGYNDEGQLGDNTTTGKKVPIQMQAGESGGTYLTDIVDVVTSGHHTIALKSDGTVYGWGKNNLNQLGNGVSKILTPIKLEITDVIKIGIGLNHSQFIKSDGTIWGIGSNSNGELGLGDVSETATPIRIEDVENATSLCTSYQSHNFYIDTDGTINAYGNNSWGKLGDGTTTNRKTPVKVINNDNSPFILTDFDPNKLIRFHKPKYADKNTVGMPMEIRFSALSGKIENFDMYYAYDNEINNESEWITIETAIQADDIFIEKILVKVHGMSEYQEYATYEYLWENTPKIPTEKGRMIKIIIVPHYVD